jgi:ABC-type antimicrobial peptide transport system permease subunit
VLSEGARIAALGVAAGAVGGYVLARLAAAYVDIELPGVLPVLASAAVLVGAAVVASLMPAARASRIDVLQALRSE